MDVNPDFVVQKKEIELSLARTILTQLESKAITYQQSQEIAKFIVLHINNTSNTQQLLAFLQSLALKWNFFQGIYDLYRLKAGEIVKTHKELEETKEKLSTITNT